MPSITAFQAKKSVALLLKLGFIKKSGKGYIQAAPLITTGLDFTSLAVRNFHRKTAELAMSAVDRFPKEQRDFSSCTTHCSMKTMMQIRNEIALCRKKIMTIVLEDNYPEMVFQCNFQVFPVSDGNDELLKE